MGFKILGISSGRVMGNAEVMLRECLMECEKLADCEVRITRLRTLKIEEFMGDYSCLLDAAEGGDGRDSFQDDLEWLKEQILWADAIIFSSPDFTYMPTSEVLKLLNRGIGIGQNYMKACREAKKPVGFIAVGGSDTVDFHLPLLYASMQAICPGFHLVDQFYANWIRGKGYIVLQEEHMSRARLQAKRMINYLNGYDVPAIKTVIRKLNPMEHNDDDYVYLEECPVCHSSVVEMHNNAFEAGTFKCAICGARGRVVAHNQVMTYEWDDDTVAHNRMHAEHDMAYPQLYKKAQSPVDGPKMPAAEFPIITPANDPEREKPYIMALVAGPRGGTSELLARKALETATQNGKYDGIIVNVLDLKIGICTGCLLCKVNSRYRGGIDECVIKDDDHWLIDKFMDAAGVVFSVDNVNGFTYSRLASFWQRFGHFTKTKCQMRIPAPYIFMVSSFDDQVTNATFGLRHTSNFFCKYGPKVAEEMFPFVPLMGDNILADAQAMGRAAGAGVQLGMAVDAISMNPGFMGLLRPVNGMCPSCGMNLIELHPDMTVSCPLCDAHGTFKHIFGENDIEWDEYSVKHSRFTEFGAMLHFRHIDYSQIDDKNALENPKGLDEYLAKYKEYGKLVRPER